jgi:hypothetical protein
MFHIFHDDTKLEFLFAKMICSGMISPLIKLVTCRIMSMPVFQARGVV